MGLKHWILVGSITVLMMMAGCVKTMYDQQYPQAEISNDSIVAKIWTPDPEKGFYRGTRFDWSGAIYSLRYQGHEYFGPWREDMTNPEIHDNIMGPVESFMANDAVLGYDEASVGETFMRIGVGLCEKPEEERYTWDHSYTILDPGKWTIKQGKNWIEFVHELTDGKGYAYQYTKRLSLPDNKPELIIWHTLENTGERTIATEVFNHNFFMIDAQTVGPDFRIEFPFTLKADRDLEGFLAIDGDTLKYPKVLKDGDAKYVILEGYGQQYGDNAFVLKHTKTGVGVRVKTDQPIHKFGFWTTHRTICPEPYIFMTIDPGKTHNWESKYEFFVEDETK